MGGTASFCTVVPSMLSSNKIRIFRENNAEITEWFTNICLSPLRTIYQAPNRRYQEVEIGEKYVWLLYCVIKSITIKCPNIPMYSFSRNSIPKPKTCRITLKLTWTVIYYNRRQPYFFQRTFIWNRVLAKCMSWLISFAWASSSCKERKQGLQNEKFILSTAELELTTFGLWNHRLNR